MSQYPFPPQPSYYPQPPLDYSGYTPAAFVDLLAPARRASVLQAILGGLTLMCGVLIGAVPHFANVAELIAASGQEMPELPPGWTMDQALKAGFGMLGGCGLVLGVAMLALAAFVRKGSRGAIVGSMVVIALVLMMLAIRMVAGLVQVVSNPAAIMDLLVAALTAGLFGLNMLWLIAAARNTAAVAAAMRQYQMQFYGYQQQQQQQAYGQFGYPPPPPGSAATAYGYGYPAPPPPAPSPPQSPSAPAQQPSPPDTPPPHSG